LSLKITAIKILTLTGGAEVSRQISNVNITKRKIDKHFRFFVLNG